MPSTSTARVTQLGRLGTELGGGAEDAAVAVVQLVDAHMTDAVRHVLALAGIDPGTDLSAFGGMGASTRRPRPPPSGCEGARPPLRPGLSAFGLVTADHIVDASRDISPTGSRST